MILFLSLSALLIVVLAGLWTHFRPPTGDLKPVSRVFLNDYLRRQSLKDPANSLS